MTNSSSGPRDYRDRFRLVPALYVIVLRDGQILMSRRRNTGFEDGRLILPSGHLEGDEEIVTAAARELAEETELVMDPEHARVIGVMHRRTGEPGHERVDFFVLAERWTGQPRNLEPEKCLELIWCEPAALPDDVIEYVRLAIDRSLAPDAPPSWFASWGWDPAG